MFFSQEEHHRAVVTGVTEWCALRVAKCGKRRKGTWRLGQRAQHDQKQSRPQGLDQGLESGFGLIVLLGDVV